MAVQQIFPSAQVTIGPVIEDGFYYDFAYKRPFTPEDLEKIEVKMWELQKQGIPYERVMTPKDEGLRKYSDAWMKCELISEKAGEEFSKSIALDPKNSDTYKNRALAYFNLKEMRKAQQDFKQACGMGNRESCELLKTLKP